MKKTLLIAGALLCLGVSMASAGGINLSWLDCGTFGSSTRTNTCLVSTGGNLLVGSAIPNNPIDLMVAMAAVLDLQTNQAALTPWWLMDTAPAPPACRTGAMTASFDFTAGPSNCVDIWAGGATGGSNYISQYNGVANHGRIRLVCAVPAPIAVDNVNEGYYFKVNISNTKTTGTGNCAGCLDAACIVFNSIELDQNPGVPGGNQTLSNPINSQFVTYQSGGGLAGACPQATPTQNKTWGSVKSLYR
jgi:hypothetical protein